jgi:hypothetical protein
MSTNRSTTDQDYELLSAYIDGALSPAQRQALEARLEAEPDLQYELNSLRQTVQLIRQLPPPKAPRDFTLDSGMIEPQRPRPVMALPVVFSALSAAAAMILFVFGGHFLLRAPDSLPAAARPAPQQIMQMPTSAAFALLPTQLPEAALQMAPADALPSVAGDEAEAEDTARDMALSAEADDEHERPETLALEAAESIEDAMGAAGAQEQAGPPYPEVMSAPPVGAAALEPEARALLRSASTPSAYGPAPASIPLPPAAISVSQDQTLGTLLLAAGLLLLSVAAMTYVYTRRSRR